MKPENINDNSSCKGVEYKLRVGTVEQAQAKLSKVKLKKVGAIRRPVQRPCLNSWND